MRRQLAGPGTNKTPVTKTPAIDPAVASAGSYMSKAQNDMAKNSTGSTQSTPGWATNVSRPVNAAPSSSSSAGGGGQTFPFGTKFNPNTGEPIPKFDPHTGRQNW
ncbi:SH3 domain-containing protein [Balamuthia mandrillaris]